MEVESFVLVKLFSDHQPAHIQSQLERFVCIAPECGRRIDSTSRVVLVRDKARRYRLVCNRQQCLDGAANDKDEFEPQAVVIEVIRELLGLPKEPLPFEKLPLATRQLSRRRPYHERVQPKKKLKYVNQHVHMLRSH